MRFGAVFAVLSAMAGAAGAVDIYGITFDGKLISIDASTGVGTLIGNTGLTGVESLEFNPVTGKLWAIAGSRMLYTVDPVTAAPTLVGATPFTFVEALAHDESSSTLYGAASFSSGESAEFLARIDTSNGAGTSIGVFGSGMTDVDALAITSDGRIFGADLFSGVFGEISSTTGLLTPGPSTRPFFVTFDFGPDDTLWGSTVPNASGGASTLYRIDAATGDATAVGDIGFNSISGLVVLYADSCPADYNNDDLVDVLDFLDFFDDFGQCDQLPAPCGTLGNPDLNGDTIIDILDFLDFLDAFGTGC